MSERLVSVCGMGVQVLSIIASMVIDGWAKDVGVQTMSDPQFYCPIKFVIAKGPTKIL